MVTRTNNIWQGPWTCGKTIALLGIGLLIGGGIAIREIRATVPVVGGVIMGLGGLFLAIGIVKTNCENKHRQPFQPTVVAGPIISGGAQTNVPVVPSVPYIIDNNHAPAYPPPQYTTIGVVHPLSHQQSGLEQQQYLQQYPPPLYLPPQPQVVAQAPQPLTTPGMLQLDPQALPPPPAYEEIASR